MEIYSRIYNLFFMILISISLDPFISMDVFVSRDWSNGVVLYNLVNINLVKITFLNVA